MGVGCVDVDGVGVGCVDVDGEDDDCEDVHAVVFLTLIWDLSMLFLSRGCIPVIRKAILISSGVKDILWAWDKIDGKLLFLTIKSVVTMEDWIAIFENWFLSK